MQLYTMGTDYDKVKAQEKVLFFSEEEKAAYDLGWINEDKQLTDLGRQVFLQTIFDCDDEYADEFYDYARLMKNGRE